MDFIFNRKIFVLTYDFIKIFPCKFKILSFVFFYKDGGKNHVSTLPQIYNNRDFNK